MQPEQLANALLLAYQGDTLSHLLDRLDDQYSEMTNIDHERFWNGVGQFVRKPDCKWIRSYSPMHEVVRNCAAILETAVTRNKGLSSVAEKIFEQLRSSGENELVPHWLRTHLFAHGLFKRASQSSHAQFLSKEVTEREAHLLSSEWREKHLTGNLIPCAWDLMTVYTMLDTGIWDEECKKHLENDLERDDALDAFVLMLYGAHYTTDKETVNQMCGYDKFISRVRKRIADTDAHD